MSEKISLTCIGCPLGCTVTVTKNGSEIEEITGYTCKRGLEYARTEVLSPVRTVTSTVRVTGGTSPVVAVKTASPIPKAGIEECMKVIYGLEVKAPVAIGDVVCDNIAETGVDLVASASCPKA
ncbi:MAG: DUF1667 domain-containing protein [Lachnospiraceae bacterium]|nr:DUF1667 domain-containing protein [Lachnospiraceae bacterium]